MKMKFNVKSALPSTALVLMSLMVVGKTNKVYSRVMDSYKSEELNAFADEDPFFIDDTFSSGDSFGSGDSFCSGDSFGSGDSFCTGDSFGSGDSSGSGDPVDPVNPGIPDGNSYAVWTVERDTVKDNELVIPEVTETLCVKKFNNVFIAQSPNSFLYPNPFGLQTVVAKGKFKPRKDLLRMEYAGDPNLGSIKTTDFRLTPVPGNETEWLGTWKSGKVKGDVKISMTFGDAEYYAYACDFYLGQ